MCHIYDLSKFEKQGRHKTDKDSQHYKQAGSKIHFKDILILAVQHEKLGVECKKLKDKNNRGDNCVEVGDICNLEYAIKKYTSKNKHNQKRHSCYNPSQKRTSQ